MRGVLKETVRDLVVTVMIVIVSAAVAIAIAVVAIIVSDLTMSTTEESMTKVERNTVMKVLEKKGDIKLTWMICLFLMCS